MAGDLLSTPPPLAPPRTPGALASWLRLIRSHRVGPSTFFRLLKEHGSAEAAMRALPGVAEAAGVPKYTPCNLETAEREIAAGTALGAKLITWGSPEYPASLQEIQDPPPLLWTLGNTGLFQKPMIAIVGARNASSLGTRMARKLASDLGEAGYVVVSGLARGIDAAAHLASLETGTVAVQAGGIDATYPLENQILHEEIAAKGLRLSDQPIGMRPHARHFPRRNRLISGLAKAVVVVEAAAKSGSLITARDALDQGREVLAVPGHPFDARSGGCNLLIRDGAVLVRGTDDILNALKQEIPSIEKPKVPPKDCGEPKQLVPEEVLRLLSPTPIAEDQLIRDLALPASVVSPEVTTLELQGKIIRHPGGLVSLSPQ